MFLKNNNYPSYPKKKKIFGQHFLRQFSVVQEMIDKVNAKKKTILEIGCGDGFLSKAILSQSGCTKLIGLEIDPQWAQVLRDTIKHPNFDLHEGDVLSFDFDSLKVHAPLVLLANLPYQISFPILFKLVKHKNLFAEGVFMVQEEVAQKLVAKKGKGYSQVTMELQHHFEFSLLSKVAPEAFSPPPKIFSRTVHFKPKQNVSEIPEESNFWKFVKNCFGHPRQTIKNNLKKKYQGNPWIENLPSEFLSMRAQNLKMVDFLAIWEENKSHFLS